MGAGDTGVEDKLVVALVTVEVGDKRNFGNRVLFGLGLASKVKVRPD